MSARVRFQQVQHQADRVAIVAAGPSLAGVRLRVPPGVQVIAVNSAGGTNPETGEWILEAAPAFWFSLDALYGAVAELHRPGTVYYHAVPLAFAQPNAGHAKLRLARVLEHVIYLRRLSRLLWRDRVMARKLGIGNNSAGLCPHRGAVHGSNSAWGAFQLAHHMGAKRIALLGVDGRGDTYAWPTHDWHPGKPSRSFTYLRPLFASAADELRTAGVDVVVGSPASIVDCWPRMEPQEALEWLAS